MIDNDGFSLPMICAPHLPHRMLIRLSAVHFHSICLSTAKAARPNPASFLGLFRLGGIIQRLWPGVTDRHGLRRIAGADRVTQNRLSLYPRTPRAKCTKQF